MVVILKKGGTILEKKTNDIKQKNNHHRMMIRDFKIRFFITLVLTIPIMLLSTTVQSWLGIRIEFVGRDWIVFVLASIVFFYGGWPFLKGSITEFTSKQIGMMTLIALAIVVAYTYSSATIFGLEGAGFFWELATLILIMLLGHWIEMRSVLNASSALEELAKLIPDEATKIEGDDTKTVQVSTLKKEDVVLIKPGEKIPMDGKIVKGSTTIDEAVITGESKPVSKESGDEVYAGSINGDQSIEVEITHSQEDSYISNVIKMVQEAQEMKSKTQNLTDVAAFWLTIVAISTGVITFTVWYILRQDIAFAITRMATVMVITCPHALGLAIPLVVANSTTLSAKNGLLIRNRTAFERARNIDMMVFDKTGTLTTGVFAVQNVEVCTKEDKEKLISYAASLENQSEHPIGKAIVEYAKEQNIELIEANDVTAMKGEGVKGTVDNKEMLLVSKKYIDENNIESTCEKSSNEDIETEVYGIISGEVVIRIALSDAIREESYDAIANLQKQGIKCWMISGDNEKTVASVAKKLGLDGYDAEVKPDQKQQMIKDLQEEYDMVAMTGDGVNDAPALTQADIGIAIGSGTDVAVESGDIIVTDSDPSDIVELTYFAKKTYQKMIQNLVWATGYNVIAIPLAAGVLYGVGIMISPALGAVLMSLSTVIVAINAKLLSFDKPDKK
ncbi:MAG: cadmium-translocating P-type ATPase [Candidatus Izimaplasma sp.]|nr:cadmium-translocating P-type ATPase [Candidatus Izimaplasma bacterium]